MTYHLREETSFRRISTIPILFILTVVLANIFVVGLNNSYGQTKDAAASTLQSDPSTNGKWKGTMNGKGEAMQTYTITITGVTNGTFDGDTSNGAWVGVYFGNYEVAPIGLKNTDLGEIRGNYATSIDKSGVISGEGSAKVTGILVGDLKFKIHGVESQFGMLNGTWYGLLTASQFNYGGTPISVNLTLQVSGEFGGIEQRTESTTSPAPTSTTPAPVSSTPTTPAQTSVTNVNSSWTDQYLLYAIVAIVLIVVLVGLYALRSKRRPRQ
jgi:hypothetical protein